MGNTIAREFPAAAHAQSGRRHSRADIGDDLEPCVGVVPTGCQSATRSVLPPQWGPQIGKNYTDARSRARRATFSVDTRSRCSSIGSTCLEPAIDARTKSLQVYIVEDSPIIRGLLASTVEAAGAELVGHSADARTAIADLSVLQPDLILVDIRLKSGSGFDVLQALQERHLLPGAVKAVLTNHANAEYEQLSFRLGADRFFDKASETAHVLPLIGTLVAQKRHEAANSTLAQ